jgi:xylan 1,4-beta-xylosidase
MTGRHPKARIEWDARIGRQVVTEAPWQPPTLDAPSDVRATAGRGQVTLKWEPVSDAIGYVVLRSSARDGLYQPIDTGNPDVMAVPGPPFADTTGRPGLPAWYAIAAIPSAGRGPGDPGPMGAHSAPVFATPSATGEAAVQARIDVGKSAGRLERPWRPIIGSEHLSQLGYGIGPGDRPIGSEFADALRLAREELGVQAVRAHAIFHDELGVYREVDGQPVHDFSRIDAVFDRLLEIGLRPIVELSFMPHDLARDPQATVFEYRAIISPPRDWERWEDLVRSFVAHLVDRYGLDEVRRWAFEVWNEANLQVFWAGTLHEYLRLYDHSARAIRAVDAQLRVGGPATAADGWVDELLAHCAASGSPVDFVTTHTYGNVPLDIRPALERHGFAGRPIWWTEWGVNAGHFRELHDSAFAGAFLVHGMLRVMGRLEALAYWTISDHFEELGRPPRLLHGGFGLLTCGNLRKPRFWAMRMLESLGDERLAVEMAGDGAGSLLDVVGTRHGDGRLSILVCNAAIDHAKATPDLLLVRRVELRLGGLPDSGQRHRLAHYRVDEEHSNIGRIWETMAAGRDWPTDGQWAELHARDVLEQAEPARKLATEGGALELAFDLPLPGISLLELTPA